MPDENEAGHRYPEQPAERISTAFASDHRSGEAGAEFSYSTPREPSSLDRDQTGHAVRDGRACGPRAARPSGHDRVATNRYRAALPRATSSTKGTNAVRSTPATSVSGSPTTGSQLSSRHQMPQRLNQRQARSNLASSSEVQARAPGRGIATDAPIDHCAEGIAGGRDSEQQPDVGRASNGEGAQHDLRRHRQDRGSCEAH